MTQYLPGFQKQTGIEVRYEKTGATRDLDREVTIHVYRVLQEALNNIAKHSRSSRADVRLRYLPQSLVLEVEDNGVGFRDSQGLAAGERKGMGLVSMRERADLVNGQLELGSGSAGGALVRLTVPAVESHA